MKKIILIMFLIFLSACTANNKEADILGNEGISMTIGQHPAEVYVGQGLQIPITLENKGVVNVENAVLSLSAPTDVVKFDVPRIEGINLQGKETFPIGEKTTKIFSSNQISLKNAAEKKLNFEAAICYQYRTEASPIVCINTVSSPDVQTKNVCDISEVKLGASQGAPIAVTSVKTIYLQNQKKMQFLISVSDVSKIGTVIDKDVYGQRCLGTTKISEENYNIVNFEVYMSEQKLQCYSPTTNKQDVLIIPKSGEAIICTASIDTRAGAYTTPLSIYLSYGYFSIKTFSITAKNPSFK